MERAIAPIVIGLLFFMVLSNEIGSIWAAMWISASAGLGALIAIIIHRVWI